ncbi:transposase [Oceanispirochaeta crateris]|uniref:Transposase n=1 Tax=Oceanispirochaeta crateris TaxID=2518645 RepID=A0A5C1QKT9_9SPIO|nr:transposase [Oceanispirochaeta crateris]QEN07819.1 transposase [Oceanispirochaeta crateris]
MAKILDLFEAYESGDLPNEGGYIISNFFMGNSSYSRIEMVSYGNVKDIYRNDEGITFQADGLKMFVLVEPPSYSNKHIEPCYRDDAHKIPYRFKEVETYTTKRQEKIMVGKEPIETYTAFTIMNETGVNQSFIVHKSDGILKSLMNYYNQVLWKNINIGRTDANKASEMIGAVLPSIINPFA